LTARCSILFFLLAHSTEAETREAASAGEEALGGWGADVWAAFCAVESVCEPDCRS
jgi:hypothetical protein